jgi:hypothetical protein
MDRLGDAESISAGWVLDTSLFDASDLSQARIQLVRDIVAKYGRSVRIIVLLPSMKFCVENIRRRHLERLERGEAGPSGAVETDGDVAKLISKVEQNWDCVCAFLNSVEAMFKCGDVSYWNDDSFMRFD